MIRQMRAGLVLLLDPVTLVLSALAVVALGVLSNALFAILARLVGADVPGLLRIVAVGLAVLVASCWALGTAVSQLRGFAPRPAKQRIEPRKGLIALVRNKDSVMRAVAAHYPELKYLWLVCSAKTVDIAKAVQAHT